MKFEDIKIKTPNELMDFLNKNIKYGFTYENKVFLEGEDFGKQMDELYRLRTGEDLIKSGYGVCWDFCEFEREFFEEMKIPHETYFFLSFLSRSEGGPTHTFLLYSQDEKWFWFEYSWQAFRGIWKYDSKEDALADIMNKFCKYNNRPYHHVEVYKTDKAKAGLNTFEFVDHCMSGEKILIKNKEWSK